MRSSISRKPVNEKTSNNDLTPAQAKKNCASNALGARAGMPVYLQRQPVEEEEEMLQPMVQRQPLEEEEEELQTKAEANRLQRQPVEEEEEELQAKPASQLQRQPVEEEEEMMQPKLQRQPLEEEEEELQASQLQRQPVEEEEEMMQPKLQRQPLEEEEEEMQTKLSVGEANDEYEQEADAVADKVMRMASTDTINREAQPGLRRDAAGFERQHAQRLLRRGKPDPANARQRRLATLPGQQRHGRQDGR